jgi:cardiolipin synthase
MQMFALGFLIVGEAGAHIMPTVMIGTALLWLAAILTFYTGYDYLRAGLKYVTAEDNPGAGTGASAD